MLLAFHIYKSCIVTSNSLTSSDLNCSKLAVRVKILKLMDFVISWLYSQRSNPIESNRNELNRIRDLKSCPIDRGGGVVVAVLLDR